MDTKACTKCGRELPATTEYFHKHTGEKLSPSCKECKANYLKRYYDKNKEKYLLHNKQYHKNNKLSVSEHHKQYYKDNKSSLLENHKRYRKDNKLSISEQSKQYYCSNKDEILQKHSYYRISHPEQFRNYSQKRRTRISRLTATLTLEQWEFTKAYFNNECCYCGAEKPLEQEHFVATTNGGGYTADNIIPSCRSCNASKRNNNFHYWYPKQDFYSMEKENKILDYIKCMQNEEGVS